MGSTATFNKRSLLNVLLWCLCGLPQTAPRPNIVVLFADNLGYQDISAYSGGTATPNVDRLAREGLKFSNWNSAAHLCSASRASLLTGKYPVRTGVYPGVFHRDAAYGMLPTETTLAEYLKDLGYATAIVGKWHLGHREAYLPLNQGFDEWLGVPYHASGGSVEGHVCQYDVDETVWLPLYDGSSIVEQPVNLQTLAHAYADRARSFIERHRDGDFFLYLPFSHVHQLCAPRDFAEQSHCQWSSKGAPSTFADAVQEMDWITGQVLDKLDDLQLSNDTIVLFTSDNGPWVAEQTCSGSKGPFLGQWLAENTPLDCTACPHDYIPNPHASRECMLPGTSHTLQGVHCGEDTGLGSLWEANLRMPALLRWPGKFAAGEDRTQLVSTLDILPTILSIVGGEDAEKEDANIAGSLDGMDIFHTVLQANEPLPERTLFFWRDGFSDGPLPQPYGRFDVAAVKVGRYKAWIWTKSAHYNDDVAVFHDPPLLFDMENDPAEACPLDPMDHQDLLTVIPRLVEQHKAGVDWTYPLALVHDPKYTPCVDAANDCRTPQKATAVD